MMFECRQSILSFSIKVGGIIQQTTDLATVEKWKKAGHLVLIGNGHGFFKMIKDGKSTVKLAADPESVDKAIVLWKKGFNFAQSRDETKKQECKEQKLNDTLERVANYIEDSNVQMANYFRNVVPYKHNGYMVVDFPTKGNKIRRVAERFKKEGKPYATKILFHGTKLYNISSIIRRGLVPVGKSRYYGGMLGEGIYVGSRAKARGYSDFVVLEVKVLLGNCKEIEVVEKLQSLENDNYDSMHAKTGKLPGVRRGYLYGEEWIIRRAEQIEISRLIVCG